MLDLFWYSTAVVYSKVYGFFHDHFGVGLPKLGYFVGKIRKERSINVRGIKFWFTPSLPSSYGRMLGGDFNENETHVFLERILSGLSSVDLFVDVGSNIGEFVIAMGTNGRIIRVIGFEPNGECVRASRRSAELNKLSNVRVVQKLLSDSSGKRAFNTQSNGANAHSLFDTDASEKQMVECSTLDAELQNVRGTAIILIDVEGAETLVMRGGERFLTECKPLVIFEYNFVSKRHFALDDVKRILPAGYRIFRLRGDGCLDSNFEQSWNCVAVHDASPFWPVAEKSIVS